jgi:predicted nucleotidyltransferase
MPLYPTQSLSSVFVEPDVVPDERWPEEKCRYGDRANLDDGHRASVPIPAATAIQSQDRVILLGHPGGGKTTVLHWLAHQQANQEEDRAELPLYVRLAEFTRAQEIDTRTNLLGFVAAMARDSGCPDLEDALLAELQHDRRRTLVLLDGLDEVGDEKRRNQLIESVRDFIERFPRNRFVISSRIVGFDPLPWSNLGFAVLRIMDFGRKRLVEFVDKSAKMLAAIHHRPTDEVLRRVKSAVFTNPRVRALAGNPLILTILVLLNESRGGTLPRRRVDLYAKIVDVFLDTWESSKRPTERFDETADIDLDARELRWLLSDLSLGMQMAGRTLAPRWWLAERMRDYLQGKLGFGPDEAKGASDRIVAYLAERTGLIQEYGLDVFGFAHRTLQEYFASLGAMDEADASGLRSIVDLLRGYFFHPQWSEVMRLVAAQQTPPIAESLLSSILDDPDPIGRFLRRGPLLALRCLSDGTTVPDRQLVNRIFSSLRDLGRSKWLGVTLEAFDVLEILAGTRQEQLARDTVSAILEMAKQELDREQYECLYERAGFPDVLSRIESLLGPAFESEAAGKLEVDKDGVTCEYFFLNTALRIKDPAAWYRSFCSLMRDRRKDEQFKEMLVRETGKRVVTDPLARRLLRRILESTASAVLRGACASALGSGGRGSADEKLLFRVLIEESDIGVRAACAAALQDYAARLSSVRDRLLRILESAEPAELRAGAADGLRKAAAQSPPLTNTLLRIARAPHEPEELRVACSWVLADQVGQDPKLAGHFKSWLDQSGATKHQRVAAQVLAEAMGKERLPWDHHLVERIEQLLMSLGEPCPHALASLEALATAREIRRGLRLESLLRDVLRPLGDRIEIAFVFGSTARNRQTEGSDIDLMLIGEVKLRDLSAPLRAAEKTLGRRISPVIYTRSAFEQKYQSGDPFLIDVYRREKIALLVPRGRSSLEDLNDELRAMVAERVASTP